MSLGLGEGVSSSSEEKWTTLCTGRGGACPGGQRQEKASFLGTLFLSQLWRMWGVGRTWKGGARTRKRDSQVCKAKAVKVAIRRK